MAKKGKEKERQEGKINIYTGIEASRLLLSHTTNVLNVIHSCR